MKTTLTILLLILCFILIMLYGLDWIDYLVAKIGEIATAMIFTVGCFGIYKLTDLMR